MKKSYAILAGLGLVAFMAGTSVNDPQDPAAVAAELARLEGLTVPVGGVIMWWGLEKDIPENFEVCDGRPPKARDAKFKHRKPELRGRFPFGAENEFRFRPWDRNIGGSNELVKKTEAGPVTESPIHVHTMNHTHPVDNHTHSLNSPNDHDHSLNNHDHSLANHTHPLNGQFTTINIATGGGTNFSLLVEESNPSDMDDTDGPDPGTTGNASGDTGGSSGSTGGSNAGTGGASPNDTGSAEVEGPTHEHDIEVEDIRPAFTQFIFIIRVK